MPEGPEVAIISKCLNTKCRNETIRSVKIWKDSRYKPNDKRFNPIESKTISYVAYKGKKIIFKFTDNSYMVSFLGMEGRWKVLDTFDPLEKHVSVIFFFDSGRILQFQDQRHFGCIDYCPDEDCLNSKLESVGIPWIPSIMFKKTVTKDILYEMLSNSRLKKKSIMMFLVDQKYTSGVGNYIRADAMYLAKINPHRLVNSLSRKESDSLFDAVNMVIENALKCGGHTLRSYFNPIGETGRYVSLVYGRQKTHPKGEDIIRELDSQKRSIFWVPDIQV